MKAGGGGQRRRQNRQFQEEESVGTQRETGSDMGVGSTTYYIKGKARNSKR